ncbi:MAG: hypothetical protein ACAH80_03430 [Alphaproteobacteria bacterium]
MTEPKTVSARIDGWLERINKVFAPGALGDKQREINALLETGATNLFEGEAQWQIHVPEAEVRLEGKGGSLTEAFMQMEAGLRLLKLDNPADGEVRCSLTLPGKAM